MFSCTTLHFTKMQCLLRKLCLKSQSINIVASRDTLNFCGKYADEFCGSCRVQWDRRGRSLSLHKIIEILMINKNVKYYWIFRFNYIFDIQLKYNNQNDIGNFSYATLLARKPSPRNWLAANSLFFPKKSVCFSEWPRSGGALPTARPRARPPL